MSHHLVRCGAASRWRWAEACRRPFCPKCYRRFARGEVAKAIACFQHSKPHQLGWVTIHLGRTAETLRLCASTTCRLRNIIDRERRRRESWDNVEARTIFRGDGDRLILCGFVHLGEVSAQDVARVLAEAWGVEAVRFDVFVGQSAEVCIQAFSTRWQTGPEPAFTSFRSMRLTVGPRWTKATRHWSPVTSEPAYLEPMPVSFGHDGPWF